MLYPLLHNYHYFQVSLDRLVPLGLLLHMLRKRTSGLVKCVFYGSDILDVQFNHQCQGTEENITH